MNGDFPMGSSFTSVSASDCEVYADGPYICSHDSTLRLRGMVGTTLGGHDIFGTLGVAKMSGMSANGPSTQASATVSGVTVGVGMYQDFGEHSLRYDLTFDRLTEFDGDPTYNTADFTSVSAGITYMFK